MTLPGYPLEVQVERALCLFKMNLKEEALNELQQAPNTSLGARIK